MMKASFGVNVPKILRQALTGDVISRLESAGVLSLMYIGLEVNVTRMPGSRSRLWRNPFPLETAFAYRKYTIRFIRSSVMDLKETKESLE